MHDSKDIDWPAGHDDEGEGSHAAPATVERAANRNGVDGWQQYRRWISKAPAPRPRRSGIDPSLYTWKGYRTWTEQVKRNWTDKQDH